MSEHKPNPNKDKLLGELESIKDLLSKEEWDDIPTLNDTVPYALPRDTQTLNSSDHDDAVTPNDNTVNEHDLIPTLEQLAEAIEQEDNTNNSLPSELNSTRLDSTVSEAETSQSASENDSLILDNDQGHQNKQTQDKHRLATAQLSTEELLSPLAELPSEALSDQPLAPFSDISKTEITTELNGGESEATTPGALPGQRSLFAQPDKKAKPNTPPQRSKATGENPFLPKHIRERLHSQQSLMELIKQSEAVGTSTTGAPKTERKAEQKTATSSPSQDDQQNTAPTAKPSLTPEFMQALIDDLVSLYIPRIETELRQRLASELEKQIHRPDKVDE